jgi:DNA-binding MarR family transcriptional regulator
MVDRNSLSSRRDRPSPMPRRLAKPSPRKPEGVDLTPPSAAKRSAGSSEESMHAATVIAVLQQFRELFRVSQQHYQRIESSCGVSGAQLWALSVLRATPGLTVSGLARKLSIHLSTSSNLLDKLEAQEFIRRERGGDDQRVVHVYLTASGKQVLRKAPKPAEGVIPDAVGKMSGPALRSLKRDLGRLLELASVRNPDAGMKPLAEP